MGSHKSRAEGGNPLPSAAGHPSVDAAQDAVALLDFKHSLLAHVELFIYQNPQVLLLRAALDEPFTQPVLMSGIALFLHSTQPLTPLSFLPPRLLQAVPPALLRGAEELLLGKASQEPSPAQEQRTMT